MLGHRLRRIGVVAAWAFATLGAAAAPAQPAQTCTSIQDALTHNKAAVEITCLPAGTTFVDYAESNQGGSSGTTKFYKNNTGQKLGSTFAPKTAGYPWAGMIAKDSSGKALGNWPVRLQTVPGGVKETKRQELEKQLQAAKIAVGGIETQLEEAKTLVQRIEGEINSLPSEQQEKEELEAKEKAEKEQKEREAAEKAQKEREAKEKAEKERIERESREKAEKERHEREEREKTEKEGKELEKPPFEEGTSSTFHKGVDDGTSISDIKKLGANPSIRLENPGNVNGYTNAGIAVVYLLNNTQNGGIKSVNVGDYVNKAKEVVKNNPGLYALEVENEPGGSWFWGSGAENEPNPSSYDHLLKEVHAAVPNTRIYASADGGHAGNNAWLKAMLKADPNVVNYVADFTEHDYDGSGANPESVLDHFGAVEEAHSLTHKPISITEYGRPLLATTGDSPRSTEAQQAKADGAMVHKAREVGYVTDVEIYGYRGDSSPCYAIFKADDTPRPAVAAIAGA